MDCSSKTSVLQGNPRLSNFLSSPYYCAAIMVLSAMAHILSLELPVYLFFTAIIVYTCLFEADLLAMLPIVMVSYIIPSAKNNPGKSTQTIFAGTGYILFAVMAVCIAGSVLFRVVRDRKQFFSGKRRCLWGLLALCGAYFLGGIGSVSFPDFLNNHLLFALMQSACLLLPYWIFSKGIRWERVRPDYFAWIGATAGGVMVVEILWSYLTQGVVVDGIIHREHIYTGWGMYNNMGFMLALSIPSVLYLATRYRRDWLGTMVGLFYLACVYLTCSRSSILGGTFIYLTGVVVMLLRSHNRRRNTVTLGILAGTLVLALVVFHRPVLHLFSRLLSKGLDPSTRDQIYVEGFKLFLKNPVFGVSFFSPGFLPWDFATLDSFSAVLPPRWHNTIIQILTSCGAVGFVAYLFHRVQSFRMLLSRRGDQQILAGCTIAVLLFCSLFDCHFFNLGPTLVYSAALAWGEFAPENQT